jgi:sterol desaturase/sphingolipid hydroxylase (fatty acid hydroxylase superfamily)
MSSGPVMTAGSQVKNDDFIINIPMNLGVNQELLVRVLVFAGVLLVLLGWESLRPRRPAAPGRWRRRLNNLLLLFINTGLLRLVMALAGISAAAVAGAWDWGLLRRLDMPWWPAFFLSIVLLDLVIYIQHVIMHKVGFLWRLHRVHHTDKDFDATTALRFHPVEILLSMAVKIGAVILLGVPLAAMIVFEILLNACAMFNHSNIDLPLGLDRWLRLIIVTPDMHRVHHSVIRRETDSNYGFCLPWWDRSFGTYRDQPAAGHRAMQIGLREFQDRNTVNVLGLLYQPLLNIKRTSNREG